MEYDERLEDLRKELMSGESAYVRLKSWTDDGGVVITQAGRESANNLLQSSVLVEGRLHDRINVLQRGKQHWVSTLRTEGIEQPRAASAARDDSSALR